MKYMEHEHGVEDGRQTVEMGAEFNLSFPDYKKQMNDDIREYKEGATAAEICSTLLQRTVACEANRSLALSCDFAHGPRQGAEWQYFASGRAQRSGYLFLRDRSFLTYF
jgi:hypothetical protein